MKKRPFRLADRFGYVKLDSEYEQRTCVSVDKQKKEMTVFTVDGQAVYSIGDLLIDFISLEEEQLDIFDEDRRQLIGDLHLVSAEDFNWDFADSLDEFTANYLKQNNISRDDFAKKLAILDLLERYADLHPYFGMLDFYTAILPCDNAVLLNELLDLKSLKQNASEILEFCFDVAAKHLNSLSAEKRYYFYHASGRGSIAQCFKTRVVMSPDRVSPKDYSVFYKALPQDFDVSKVWELASLHDLKNPQEVTADTVGYLNDADVKLVETYEIASIADIVYLELYQMLLCNAAVKKCALCGRYFVVKGDYDNKYCDRKMKGKKQTCQQNGSSKDFRARMSKSLPQVEYTKAYKRMHSRIHYGMLTKTQFTTWCGEAKKQTALCEQGKLSLDELKVWLGNK